MKRLIECLMICVKNSELCRIEANGANKKKRKRKRKRKTEGQKEGEKEERATVAGEGLREIEKIT